MGDNPGSDITLCVLYGQQARIAGNGGSDWLRVRHIAGSDIHLYENFRTQLLPATRTAHPSRSVKHRQLPRTTGADTSECSRSC